ncbi:lipoprotein BUG3 [Streptococcus agalactiae]|uniref:lipoprotein BUG3 n=1 Tax=Streptococcus agalactiae TaxID=1311 RepID=UPI003C774A3D
MKKYVKWLISISIIGMTLGGCRMTSDHKNQSNEIKNNKQSAVKKDKKMTKKEQLAYLKEHEQEIIDFVKSQNEKIESVQIDWEETQWDEASNGTPQGGGKIIDIYGGFNKIKNSGWHIMIDNDNNKVDLKTMTLTNYLSIGGKRFE